MLAPLLVIALFAALLPLKPPVADVAASDADCLDTTHLARRTDRPALALLERCVALAPEDLEVRALLAAAYDRREQPDKAEAAYREILARDPDYAEIRLRLGRLLLVRGLAGEAEHQATQALIVQPNREALLQLRDAAREARERSAR